jgi:WD40 repeat protein
VAPFSRAHPSQPRCGLCRRAEVRRFSPVEPCPRTDGRLVATAFGDKLFRVWSIAAPAAPLAELTGHTAVITSISYSPDGSTLASSSWDGMVRLWVEQ